MKTKEANNRRLLTPLSPALAAALTFFAILLISSTAKADICVLPKDSYTLTGAPCTSAYANYGSNDTIQLTASPTATMQFDIVFEQRSGEENSVYGVSIQMNFTSTGSKLNSPICIIDPTDWFNSTIDEICLYKDSSNHPSIELGAYNINGTYFPTTQPPPNFLAAEITFDSSRLVKDDIIDFSFITDMSNEIVWTDVVLDWGCFVFQNPPYEISTDACYGKTTQKAYKTKITIAKNPCVVNTITSVGAPTCKGLKTGANACPGTDAAKASAQAEVSFTAPATCHDEITNAPVACTPSIKVVRDGIQSNPTSPGKFTETIIDAIGASAATSKTISYTIKATDYSGICNAAADVTSTPVSCKCPDPPTIVKVAPDDIMVLHLGQTANIKYKITYPADATETRTVKERISQIVFYHTNILIPPILGTCNDVQRTTFNNSIVQSDDTFTVPYTINDERLFYGVTVKDVDALAATFPINFDCSAINPTNSSIIYGSDMNKPFINKGWNLLGISQTDIAFNQSDILSDSSDSIVSYNGLYNFISKDGTENLQHGAGYWIYSNEFKGVVSISGNDFTGSNFNLLLKVGWNIFADPFINPIKWGGDNTILTCNGIPKSLPIYYYSEGSGYTAIQPDNTAYIYPWTGYLINIKDIGCLLQFIK